MADHGEKKPEEERDDDEDQEDTNKTKDGLFREEGGAPVADEKTSNTDARNNEEDRSGKAKKKKNRSDDQLDAPEPYKTKKRATKQQKSEEPEHAPDADTGDTTGVTGTTGTIGATEEPPALSEGKKRNSHSRRHKRTPLGTPPLRTAGEKTPSNSRYAELNARIAAEKLDVDSMIRRVLSVAIPGKGLTKSVPIQEIQALIRVCRFAFQSGPMLIEVEAPINICGDTHGQYGDLLRLFRKGGFPPTSNYLFLGDYVDRGAQNLEVIILLLCYRLAYPGNFVLLRGNHECRQINRIYGFYDEINRRFNSPALWNEFQDMFDWMPLCGLVSRRILCMHGGISPKIMNPQWRDLIRAIPRPCHPDEGMLAMDLLWSDPVSGNNGFLPNPRGASFGFGENSVSDFCTITGIDLVARGHQVVQDGYEFFANRKLVTVFSAPFYCGQFNNCASILCVNEDLQCSFIVMRGHAKLDSAPEDPKMPVQDIDTSEPRIADMTIEEMDSKASLHHT